MTPARHRGRHQPRSARVLVWTGTVLLILGVLPLVSVYLSTVIANAAGCEVNESSANPCVIAGVDVGPALMRMFVSGWLMLVSLPVGAVGLALLIAGMFRRLSGRGSPR